MTAPLRLNGIEVYATPSAELTPEEFGGEDRAEDLAPLFSRRATKMRWSFTGILRTMAEALALRDLLSGRGIHVLSFETNSLYTKKGLAPASAAGGFTVSSSNPKFGTYRAAATASNTATWAALPSGSAWSVALWHTADGGVTWTHYVVRSDGAKWVDGVRNDAAATGFVGVSAGVLTLGHGSAAGFDDVVAFPFLVPATWPAQIYGFGYAFGGNYPRSLTADGLLIEQNTRTEVIGKVSSVRMGLAGVGTGGAVEPAASVAFELREV